MACLILNIWAMFITKVNLSCHTACYFIYLLYEFLTNFLVVFLLFYIRQCDIFSLGITMYEVWSGQLLLNCGKEWHACFVREDLSYSCWFSNFTE